MRVSGIQVEHFAKDEYSELNLRGIDGGDLLIQGGNRTGKTLSLNAILYNLLGSQSTIDLATGRGNQVELRYTNGVRFYRGVPEAEYEDESSHVTAGDAIQRFAEEICTTQSNRVPRRDIIRSHFLHSHTGRLPLLDLSSDELLSVVRSVVEPSIHSELEYHQRAESEITSIIEDLEVRKEELGNDLQDAQSEVTSASSELEKWERVLDLYQSGRLAEINEELATRQAIRSDLSQVYQEQEGLRKERRTLSKEESRWEEYHQKEVTEVISNAVVDFVCPVCEDHVRRERAENRIEQGYCPFCGEKKSISELKSEIREQIDVSNERLEEIQERKEEITDRLEELDEEEEGLKSELPNIDELDSFVERRLRENGYELDGIESRTKEEIEKNSETVEQGTEKVEVFETRLDELVDHIESLEDSAEVAADSISEIESESEELIDEFQRKWSENYSEVADELSLDVLLTNEGDVVLPGNTDDRVLSQEGDFSDAEIRLLNISFATTVNEFATESGITSWNTIVIDEPFTYLDEDSTECLIDYIRNSDQQFIVTSSGEGFESYFDKTTRLTRNTLQTTFQRFA